VTTEASNPTLPPRLRRAIEIVYAIEGVVGARLWQWPGRVAVGITVGPAFGQPETLRRVEAAVAHLQHVEEAWEFGLLDAA